MGHGELSELHGVTDIVGLTPAEYFVLYESDGHVQLWELAAGWTDNGGPGAALRSRGV
jgi:hypothetical protein